MTFTIAICFMSGETKEDYDFPIQQLLTLNISPTVFLTDCDMGLMKLVDENYPFAQSFLCRWHVNKNIFSHCIKRLGGDEEGKSWKEFIGAWYAILNALTEEAFTEKVNQFNEKYDKDETAECVRYIKKTWLTDDRKVRLCSAWVDKHRHFQTTVTSRYFYFYVLSTISWCVQVYHANTRSRVESAHAMLKSYLGQARVRQNLITTWRNLENAIINQVTAIKANEATQKIRTPWEFMGRTWEGVHHHITWQAMTIARDSYLATPEPLGECTGRYHRVTGLPCPHTINDKRTSGLCLQDFDPHWLWSKAKRSPPIREPPMLIDRQRRLKGRQQERSAIPYTQSQDQSLLSKRIPSMFERVQSSLQKRALPTCSRCHIQGHTRSSRLCLLKGDDPEISSRTQTVSDDEGFLTAEEDLHVSDLEDICTKDNDYISAYASQASSSAPSANIP